MKSGYAPVNGLEMYYEIHGSGGVPLVLLHGAFSAIGTSFAPTLPGLSANRQVIGLDLQAHGRTADIDRPLRIELLADDVVALLDYLEIPEADVFGYSNGAAVALNMAINHPTRVRRLVFLSGATTLDGIQPGLMDGLGEMSWEMMKGTPWYDEYQQIAPRPEDFPILFAKKSEMDKNIKDVPDDDLRGDAAADPDRPRRRRPADGRARHQAVPAEGRRRLRRHPGGPAHDVAASGDPRCLAHHGGVPRGHPRARNQCIPRR